MLPTNPNIAQLTPYLPGKPVDELARELGLQDIIKLASNENPRGPSQQVLDRVSASLDELTRYPDGNGYRLKQALAQHHGVAMSQITLGNGSNDVLELAAKAALEPGCQGMVTEHAFVVHRLAVLGCGGELVTVAAQDYGADLAAMAKAITPATRIIFLANPNNPTGTWVDKITLQSFLDAIPENVWMVLDEAYWDYVTASDYPDGMALLKQYPNLIVTRTFSKIYGLAGLRIGYAVSSAEVADMLNRARQPFNVNSLALVAAETALGDTDYLEATRVLNAEGMQQLGDGLSALGINTIASVGNFICADVGPNAPTMYDALLKRGVIVRPVAEYGLPQHLRVSIGLPEENARFLATLGDLLSSSESVHR